MPRPPRSAAPRAVARVLAQVLALGLALVLLGAVPAAADETDEPTPGEKVLRRYDAVVAHHHVPAHPAVPLRERVEAAVRYAGLGADTDARFRLQQFREQVTREKREGDLVTRQARALKRFSRRAAEILGL